MLPGGSGGDQMQATRADCEINLAFAADKSWILRLYILTQRTSLARDSCLHRSRGVEPRGGTVGQATLVTKVPIVGTVW